MLAKLITRPALPEGKALEKLKHVLVVLPAGRSLPEGCPEQKLLEATLKRRDKKVASLGEAPVVASSVSGGLRCWCGLDIQKSPFEQQVLLRKALKALLDEQPARVDVLLVGDEAFAARAAGLAAWIGLANGTPLPTQKKKEVPESLRELALWGGKSAAQA